MNSSIDSAATPPAPPTTSVWEDIAEIFISPSSVYARRRHGRYGTALLIYLVVVGALAVAGARAMAPATEADQRRVMTRIAADNPAMQARMEQQGAPQGDSPVGMAINAVSAVAMSAIGIFVAGLATWIIGLLFGASATIGTAVMIVTFAQFPRIIQQIVTIVQAVLLDPSRLTSVFRLTPSAARFLDPDATPLATMLMASRLDPFLLWSTALIGIGMHVAGGLSKGEAAAVAILVWVLGTGPILIPALLF